MCFVFPGHSALSLSGFNPEGRREHRARREGQMDEGANQSSACAACWDVVHGVHFVGENQKKNVREVCDNIEITTFRKRTVAWD